MYVENSVMSPAELPPSVPESPGGDSSYVELERLVNS